MRKPAAIPAPPFTGFRPATLAFLRALAANQERAWFLANKDTYERDVRTPMAALVVDLAAELARRNLPLTGDPARSIFRVQRDVRFSRDKSPYKTHVGAVLTRDGRKNNPGLLYIHVDPAGSFMAAGFYHMEPEALDAVREAILTEPDDFLAVEAGLHAAGLEFSRDESLTRLPRGFEHAADHQAAYALKLRNYTVHRALPATALRRAALVRDLADFAATAMPLLQFGWRAIAQAATP
jgi:uncharacterized protein (TIGR02453 family)